jgi:hypothetical protein
MTSAQTLGTPLPVGASVTPGTLRERMEELRAQGTNLTLKQAIAVVVPLCVEVAQRHGDEPAFFLHPSSLVADDYGYFHLAPEHAYRPPTLPRDKACLAPEQRDGAAGNARSSVFAVGAILYELLTGLSVGPGMRRPTELASGIPPQLELILSKALVADPRYRPDDLYALAQALHNIAPEMSIRPPPADESQLDVGGDFAVDVSMSMLPPPVAAAPAARAADGAGNAGMSPYDMVVRQAPPKPVMRDDQTSELAALKARLESDPRPRYVVIKDGMDHGPFSAVELLQQIGNHTFVDSDVLRDSFSKEERPLKDWDEFAPFAEHARIHRDIKAEKEAIERVVVQEGRSTRGKAILGIVGIGALLVAAGVWFLTTRGQKKDDVAVQGDTVTNVEGDQSLNVATRKGGGKGSRVVGRSGGYPILGGGMSCESAQAAYVEEMNVGGPRGQADVTAGQYGSILNRGSYFGHCGVPGDMGISICAAVQNGRAVGVTIRTTPRNPKLEGCIAGGVRGLQFPSHPKLDVTRTTF